MRLNAARVNRFLIVNRLPLRPTLLGQRLVRPSVRRRARLAGVPRAVTHAIAACAFLVPRPAASTRRQPRIDAQRASLDKKAHLIRSLQHMVSRATLPVTLRTQAPHAAPPGPYERAALERLKDIDRLDAYVNALADATCAETGLLPSDGACTSHASMDIIERYVDAVRKAQGKRTYAELDPADANFEAQLDDFVADIFRAMGAAPRT